MFQTSSDSRARRRPAVFVLYLVFLLGLVEVGSRTYWTVSYGMPLRSAGQGLPAFYPGLTTAAAGGRDTTRILLLGGSVVHSTFGAISDDLHERLTVVLDGPVRIHNLAQPGHTSRDSYLKYRYLSDTPFDAVIFYHGINEVRFNAAPPDVYADDYSHVAWYRNVNDFVEGNPLSPWATPYTIRQVIRRAAGRFGWLPTASLHEPSDAWLVHADSIKTAAAFEQHLGRIATLAESKGEPVIVGTFAYHIPEGYTRGAFDAGRLAYARHLLPVELWGTPTSVSKGIEAHNAVVRRLTDTAPSLTAVETARTIPRDAEHFNDVCHLTISGSRRWVDEVLPALLGVLARRG